MAPSQSPPAQSQSPPGHEVVALDLDNHPPLELDESDAVETDSAYSEAVGSASYVSSLSSSIKNYKYENGRRYHAYREGSYILPNDEEEQDRMDLLHHIYLLLLGGELQMAPIKGTNPQRVLDIGTGTGIWAIQFADEFPSAQVIGTDLSPIQPPWVPPNCVFEIDDFDSPWLFKTPFDFIHGRELEGCSADEDQLFSRAFEHLRPGGWFEFDGAYAAFLSDDKTHEKAENSQLFIRELQAAAFQFGKSVIAASEWKTKMEKAGFINVKETVIRVPVGPWPKDPKLKEIGRYQQVQQIQAIESYMPALFSRVLGWSKLEMEVLAAKSRNELKDRKIHIYVPAYFVYGQKPPT